MSQGNSECQRSHPTQPHTQTEASASPSASPLEATTGRLPWAVGLLPSALNARSGPEVEATGGGRRGPGYGGLRA